MPTPLQHAFDFGHAKRWRDRRLHWIPPGPLFDPRRHRVEPLDQATAMAFVRAHHYSGTATIPRHAFGLFQTDGPRRLIGAALYGRSTNEHVVPHLTGFPPDQGIELNRFVLLDEAAYDAESWTLAQTFAQLRRLAPAIAAIVAYADPVPRHDTAGRPTKQAHWGKIYQATNCLYAGRSRPRRVYLAPDGSQFSDRNVAKIVRQTQGHRYAERQLAAYGAPPRLPDEPADRWLHRVLASGILRPVPHPGCLAFAFALRPAARARLLAYHGMPRPYPRPTTAEA